MSYDFSSFTTRAAKTVDHIKSDIATLRTGRASAQVLDPVVVEAYGSRMSITELATVQAPDPSLLVISPWDKNLLEAIEKAIASSELNLNPVVTGDIIRIAIPSLTEEKRLEMVKLLHKKIETGKVMLRNLRTDIKQEIEAEEEGGGVSEDDIHRDLEELEKKFKSQNDLLDQLAQSKEKELMTV